MLSKLGFSSRRNFIKAAGAMAIGARAGRAGGSGSGAWGSGMLPTGPAEEVFPRRPRPEIHVGSRRQLLFDDFFLYQGNPEYESYAYGIRWSGGRVEKSPNSRILRGDQPWEGPTNWLSILHDEGRFRMWYYQSSKSPDEGSYVGYAESDDGLHGANPF